tara:strand:+ start:8268 stop:10922 length:2655 start_codon:yes stop_codon:yes gene_type:complete
LASNIELAREIFEQNKFQETINICNDILAKDNNSIDALKLISKSFLATNQIEDARLFLNRAIKLRPKDYEAIKDLGDTYKDNLNINEAKSLYQRSILINDRYAPALTNLGRIKIKEGNHKEGIYLQLKATQSDPKFAPAWGHLANTYINLGDLKKGEEYIRKYIDLKPNYFYPYFILANIFIEKRNLKEAEINLIKTINLNPNFFMAHVNLGGIYNSIGKLKEAEKSTRNAIKIKPDFADAHNNLGTILLNLDKHKEAEICIKKAIRLRPDFAEAYSNLGNIQRYMGELKAAEISQKKAIKLNPSLAEAYSNQGIILKDLGKLLEAEISTRKAIELSPNCAETHLNLGSILKSLGNLQEAETSTRRAIDLKPDLASAHSNLGNILKEIGKLKEANIFFKSCLRLDPNNLAYHIQCKLLISKISLSQGQIEVEREEINRQISIIGKEENIIYNNKSDISYIGFIFYLAYHNCDDDKIILKNIANNLSKKSGLINKSFNKEKQIKSMSKRESIRLGICSDFLYSHSISYCYLEIIKDFANSGIEVIIFKSNSSNSDNITKSIESIVSKTIILPDSLGTSCQLILNESIDILCYLDIAMSAKTYLMSLSRLALVQVLTAGHPNTSGSPNIDYFISSKNVETEDSDKYYSERLIRLNRLTVNSPLIEINESKFKRTDLNISDNDFLIGLPHSLFKYHPDFDYILDRILEEIPNAYLLFFEVGKRQEIDLLKSRWGVNSKLILKRVITSPRVEFDKYLAMIKTLDIILDPFYVGMGTTFYHSMAAGVPVVSMPTNQNRGRLVYAAYKQMGVKNPPIATSPEEYISLCRKLASNNSYKEDIKNQILSKSKEKLFNDKTIFKEYIEFFMASIDAAKNNKILPLRWKPDEEF